MTLFVTLFEWLSGLGDKILTMNKKADFNEDGSNGYFMALIIIFL